MRFNPVRYCSGTEKFPPPSGYLAENPHPTKTGGKDEDMNQYKENNMELRKVAPWIQQLFHPHFIPEFLVSI
jgi:hypothetical protein